MWLTIGSGIERGTTVEVTGPRFVIGRDDECDLVLDDDKVSRRHAALTLTDGGATLEDLDSANGTFVNGRRIHEPTELRPGDLIRLGAVILKLEV
jgi:S-DNA-T family DNA segregation ATPase FtsK/SpoIIIE